MRETEPTTVTQGEKLEWRRCFADYPAGEWTLQYRFRGGGPGFDVTADADGDTFEISVAGTETKKLVSGKYQWQAWLTENAVPTNTFVIASGSATVKRGFVSGTTGDIDLRSDAKIALDAINAAIQSRATSDQLEYEISTPAGTRRIRRMPLQDLLAARDLYAKIVAREVAAERVRNGGKFGKQVKVRMWEQ